MSKILVIGSSGQIGIDLVLELRRIHGQENVIATDIKEPCPPLIKNGPFYQLDVLDKEKVLHLVQKENITEVYLLAALLSAIAEQKPHAAWKLNMDGLLNILELGKEGILKKIFWPSSIAVFGSNSPKTNTPQHTIMEPSTIYGISKLAGERWCEYYHEKYGVDVRSIRYPGLISYKSKPGGGTTDYAIEIFEKAINKEPFSCFLSKDTMLPMMYMEDAIRATIEIMQAPIEKINIRSSYNIAGISFTPDQIAKGIEDKNGKLMISYNPDYRQKIADSWPDSIDDNRAKSDWNWSANFNLNKIIFEMLKGMS
ncbi:MAG: NAD-dependent epimerase/dehydratase family protein [Crocinitomicaceae bacterium]|jgi:nucleoside-diphosphate-sugar epimerase|nr:NAD-dependent epimerase/dehydratase family protein [Crocinitomicaceae bacterium]